ncbi:MAG: prephenate dehydrogenase/arogenate dehydrogenase family protein, partial [archaeon]
MKIKTISIIGGTGAMGSMFKEAWEKQGYKVIVAGRATELTPIDAAKQGDLVIVSVPIPSTAQVLQDISQFVKPDAILSDFTSIKQDPCKQMLLWAKPSVNIIGGHPVFGPGMDIKGQPFVMCNARASKEAMKSYAEVMQSIGLNVIEMSTDEHDKQMAVIQCLNHLSNLSFAQAIKNLKFDVNKQDLFSPAFMLKLNVIGRMLSQDASLYANIETYNPYAREYAKRFLDALLEIKKDIDTGDKPALEKKIKEMQAHFGKLRQESILSTTKLLKEMPKHTISSEQLAVLGPEYSYGHILATKAFPKASFVLCNNIEDIFKKVSTGEIKIGLAPIENMLNGSVRESISSLKKYKVKINHLFNFPIHHCFAAKSDKFKKIVSHPQALAQCSKFLEQYKEKGITLVEATSTSKAMELAAANKDYAAIGSKEAASNYKLNIIQESIEDNPH